MTVDPANMPLEEAIKIAASFVYRLGVRCEIAGSIRRRKELVGDIDIVAVENAPRKITGAKFIKGGDRLRTYAFKGIQVNVMLSSEAAWGASLLFATGSGKFNKMMRGLAKSKDLKLNRYGLWYDGMLQHCATEEGIFERLGLAYVPPSEREIGDARSVAVAYGMKDGASSTAYGLSSAGANVTCECRGFKFHGSCYHADAFSELLDSDRDVPHGSSADVSMADGRTVRIVPLAGAMERLRAGRTYYRSMDKEVT